MNVCVLLGLGLLGFVGSADHVLALALAHGQHGPGAWTIVGSVEVLAAYSGWQVSRREGWRRAVALVVLALAAGFTIMANLASTGVHNPWGYTLAVTPAVVFLAAVVLAETAPRPARKPTSRSSAAATRATSGPATPVATPVAPVATGVAPPAAEPVTTEPRGPSSAARVEVVLREREMSMGEVIAVTGLPRSTAKKAVGELRLAGRVEASGDPRAPVYRWRTHDEPAASAAGS